MIYSDAPLCDAASLFSDTASLLIGSYLLYVYVKIKYVKVIINNLKKISDPTISREDRNSFKRTFKDIHTVIFRIMLTCWFFHCQVSPGCLQEEQGLLDSLVLLGDHGLDQLLGSWLLETLQMCLSSSVVPEFWSGLKQPENELEERDRALVLLAAFRTLLDRLQPSLGK